MRKAQLRTDGWPLLHPALLPIGQVLIHGERVEPSEGLRLLAVPMTVLLLAGANYLWTHDEKEAAVAGMILSVLLLVEGILGIELAG